MFKDFNFKKFREDAEKLLKPLEEEYGILISGGSIVFDSYRLKFTICGEEPNDVFEHGNFVLKCKEYGFTPRDYKRKVIIDKVEYLFVGFCEDEMTPCNLLNLHDKKMYQADEDLVAENFSKAIIIKPEVEKKNVFVDLFEE